VSLLDTFNEKGYALSRGVFSKLQIDILEKEFDRIVKQLKQSGENINARWGSELTKSIENQDSEIIHTHNVQSISCRWNIRVLFKPLWMFNQLFHRACDYLFWEWLRSATGLVQNWSFSIILPFGCLARCRINLVANNWLVVIK